MFSMNLLVSGTLFPFDLFEFHLMEQKSDTQASKGLAQT